MVERFEARAAPGSKRKAAEAPQALPTDGLGRPLVHGSSVVNGGVERGSDGLGARRDAAALVGRKLEAAAHRQAAAERLEEEEEKEEDDEEEEEKEEEEGGQEKG